MYYARVCACTGVQCVSTEPHRGKCLECKQFYKSLDVDSEDPRIAPETIINAGEAELESANFHSIGSLPSALWEKLKLLVPPRLHRDLAKAIVGCMPA